MANKYGKLQFGTKSRAPSLLWTFPLLIKQNRGAFAWSAKSNKDFKFVEIISDPIHKF